MTWHGPFRSVNTINRFFDLDPNRVADLVLDAFEADAGNTGGGARGITLYLYFVIHVSGDEREKKVGRVCVPW